ncbi:conserved protein, unknown function [Plasmodium yoelii]|nr:conserved protein, unknown function [Plasmodium yoelii]CDU16472.1 conserved Plasmodium protein, unknown function [Plasmodium yoelii]VTZ73284.1 conserved protein, unknown function [Plasmodium yoelii]|eukprot:XP_022811548.1 conserved protein, unknown function [Plasmodium yoelii]
MKVFNDPRNSTKSGPPMKFHNFNINDLNKLKINDDTIFENETYDNDFDNETHEFYNSKYMNNTNKQVFPYETLYNIEAHFGHLNKTGRNYENKLANENDLIFKNEMLKNLLNSSQKVKDMQRKLINVDERNFIQVLPPESKRLYSIPREFPNTHINIKENKDANYNYINNKNHIIRNTNKLLHNNKEYEGNVVIHKNKYENRNVNNNNISIQNKSNLETIPKVNNPEIGEIKVNIDDIKTGLLSYYSNVFSLDHYDIEDRLNILKYGKKQDASNDIKYSYINRKNYKPVNRLSFIQHTNELNGPNSSSYQHLKPEYYYNEMDSNTQKMYSYNNSPCKYTRNSINDCRDKYDHAGQISELLLSLKNKCDNANFKTENIISRFNRKYENPDSRFWIHNLVPTHLRKPQLNNEDGIRSHLVETYSQLYNEAMLNTKKITTLEKKLHILKLRAQMFKNGYNRMETRNAL